MTFPLAPPEAAAVLTPIVAVLTTGDAQAIVAVTTLVNTYMLIRQSRKLERNHRTGVEAVREVRTVKRAVGADRRRDDDDKPGGNGGGVP